MKIAKVHAHFKGVESFFSCPICQTKMIVDEASIKCENNHTYDLSKYKYINFLRKTVNTPYTKELFDARRVIFEDEFYDDILNKIVEIISSFETLEEKVVLDAGSGEGFFAERILKNTPIISQMFACDIEKSAVILGARYAENVKFFVGEIGNLPIKDKSVDIILNIFSPANYDEFKRVLKPDGIMIKVIPNKNYLKELRQAVGLSLKNDEYSNQSVLDLFNKNLNFIGNHYINKTFPLKLHQAFSFSQMTPMTFNIEKSEIDLEKLTEMTIDVQILVGRFKNV